MLKQLKGLFKDSSIYGLGEFMNKGTQVLFLPLIFRYLPTEDFGILEYFLTFKNLFAVALGWGVITSIQRFGDEREGHSIKSVVSSSLYSMIFIDLVISLLLCVGAYFWMDDLLGENLFEASLITIITSFLFALRSIPFGILRLKREPTKYLIVSFSNIIIYLLITSILIINFNLTFMAFLYGGLIGISVSTLLGYIYVSELLTFNLNLGLAKRMYVFGASVLTTSLCFVLLTSTSRLFLSFYGSFVDVAIVGIAIKLSLFVGAILVAPFGLAWLPFVNEISGLTGFQDIIRKVQLLYTIASGLLILTISLFSREILMLANDQEYMLASDYVSFFAISYLLQGLYLIYSSGIYLQKKSKHYLYIALGTTAVNLILYIVFLDYLTILVASLITVASFMFQLGITIYYSRDIIKIKLLNKDMVIVMVVMLSILFTTDFYVDFIPITYSILLRLVFIILFLLVSLFLTSANKDLSKIVEIFQEKFLRRNKDKIRSNE